MATQANLDLAQTLYIAYYGRPADRSGLNFWAEKIEADGVESVLADFGTSAEFDARFGDLTNEQLVNNLYNQLFGRDAELEGLEFWAGKLQTGELNLVEIAYEIANGAQDGEGGAPDAATLAAKLAAANAFTAAIDTTEEVVGYQGDAAADAGREFLAGVEAGDEVTAEEAQASLNAVISANNPGVTLTLTEDLATLLELDELPAEYTVTDASVDLGALAVADVTPSLEKAQAIVDGAANADELELDATYSVEDTLTNLLGAEEVVLEGAASYTVDASVPRVNNAATVAEAAAALALVAGAANADELVVEDLYVWKIEDSAANIVAAIESGAVTGADEVRVAFEEGDQLTVEQAEALATLDNLVGDLPPVDQDGAVLSGLQKLETAQTDVANFLEANADNELLEDQGLGENPTNAEVAAAIRQADVEADEDVVAKENAVLDAEATLAGARTVEFGSYSAAGNDGIGADADVTGTSNTQVVGALDSVSATTRMSDANLAAAATEAQANVTADERVYAESDGTTLVEADGTTATGYEEVFHADVNGDGTADTYITDAFADVAQVTTVDLSGLVSTSTFSITVNGTAYTIAWSTDLDTTGGALATEVAKDSAVTAAYNAGTLTITAVNAGEVVTISNTGDGGAATNTTEAFDTSDFDTSDFIANNESVGFAASTDVTSGKVDGAGDENVITETATAAELQAAVAATANEVTSARAATSDADLLSAINAAINGYLGAGGDNVEADTGATLLDLRSDITTALDVAEGETVELTKANGVFNADDYSSEKVLVALAGNTSATVNENDIATVDAPDAPTSGEGTWVKGAETSTPGTFTFTYEPSAEEQALVNAVKGVEGRVTLLDNQATAEGAFEASVTGGVFNTVEALVAERDGLKAAIDTANNELSAAQDTANDTQALVDQLDTLEQKVTDAETHLTEELGVNLVDFDETTNVATATSQDDVILLSAAEDGDSIANFGGVGEDRLYVGTDFTLKNVETGVDVAGSAQGDSSVLEVFVQQTAGGNTELFFEEETFGGSATQGNELTQVTLTGVTGEVSISEDGFLTIA